jgi:hypothetical protein
VPASPPPRTAAATPQGVLATIPVPSFPPTTAAAPQHASAIIPDSSPHTTAATSQDASAIVRFVPDPPHTGSSPRTTAASQHASTVVPGSSHLVVISGSPLPERSIYDLHLESIRRWLERRSDLDCNLLRVFMHCISVINRALDLQLQPQLRQRMSTA